MDRKLHVSMWTEVTCEHVDRKLHVSMWTENYMRTGGQKITCEHVINFYIILTNSSNKESSVSKLLDNTLPITLRAKGREGV